MAAVNPEEVSIVNDPRNYGSDRPTRSTRNTAPMYKTTKNSSGTVARLPPVSISKAPSRKRTRKESTAKEVKEKPVISKKTTALKGRPAVLKKLTAKRHQLILDFLTSANACPPRPSPMTTDAWDGWKGELLNKLNKMPYSSRPGCAIRRIDLDNWLKQNGVFSQMVQQLEEKLAQPDPRPQPKDEEESIESDSPSSEIMGSSRCSSNASMQTEDRDNIVNDDEKPCTSAQAVKRGGFPANVIFVQPSPTHSNESCDSGDTLLISGTRNNSNSRSKEKVPEDNQMVSANLQASMSNTADSAGVTQGSQLSSVAILGNGQDTRGQPVNNEPITSEERIEHFRRIHAHIIGIMHELQELSNGGYHDGNVEVARNIVNTFEAFYYYNMNPDQPNFQ